MLDLVWEVEEERRVWVVVSDDGGGSAGQQVGGVAGPGLLLARVVRLVAIVEVVAPAARGALALPPRELALPARHQLGR